MRYWSLPVRPGRALQRRRVRCTRRSTRTGGCRTARASRTTRLDLRPRDRQPVHHHPGITGISFIGTQVALVWATCPLRGSDRAEGRPVRQATYFHGSQRLEVVWTIIPAAILVFIALYQMGTWAEHQVPQLGPQGASRWPRSPPGSSSGSCVTPAPTAGCNTPDDLHLVNDLHFVKDKTGVDLPEVAATCSTRSSCRRCGSSRTPCPA